MGDSTKKSKEREQKGQAEKVKNMGYCGGCLRVYVGCSTPPHKQQNGSGAYHQGGK
jgi:hypothetical protein